MSVKVTEELTRDDAIFRIITAKQEILREELEISLTYLTNADLEKLLEVYCQDDFKNYSVYDKLF